MTCILCKSVVRSESVWTVHINAKQHKQNVELARKLKERTNNFTTPVKRPLSPPQVVEIPEKKPKGILKNANPKPVTLATKIEVVEGKNGLPNDFFDNGTSKPSINKTGPAQHEKMDTDDAQELPEGFFDDPKLDAKVDSQHYTKFSFFHFHTFRQGIKSIKILLKRSGINLYGLLKKQIMKVQLL